MDVPKVNGKNWLAKGLLQVLIILALGTYIAIDKLSAGPGPKLLSDRVLVLEECVKRLQTVPEDMAAIKVQVRSIEATLGKIERKMER